MKIIIFIFFLSMCRKNDLMCTKNKLEPLRALEISKSLLSHLKCQLGLLGPSHRAERQK